VKDNSWSQLKPGGLQLHWQARTQHLHAHKRHKESSEKSKVVMHAQRLFNTIPASELFTRRQSHQCTLETNALQNFNQALLHN